MRIPAVCTCGTAGFSGKPHDTSPAHLVGYRPRLPLAFSIKKDYYIIVDKQQRFLKSLRPIDLSVDKGQVRLLAILSAAIAVCRNDLTKSVIIHLRDSGISEKAIYETIVQSYLFLGFPRMIEAALVYNEIYGDKKERRRLRGISPEESRRWLADGERLCMRVYGRNYTRLREKFLAISPEIFRWMVLEGYGKVLSRPGMNQVERELAEVAALIVDGRERQLLSHILGSLNVGADIALIGRVMDDIRPLAGNARYLAAREALESIRKKYGPEN
jgi:alkylhydroperoxidase/carboxymuconolactone decarboxylase family protein YurZ